MEYIALGNTSLLVSRVAFGAMSLGVIKNKDDAVSLVKTAYNAGVNFFDVGKHPKGSEMILAQALKNVRQDLIFSTKTNASSVAELLMQLEESLGHLQTQYIDIYMIENPKILPQKDNAIYNQLCQLKESGKIGHLGIASDNLDIAKAAIDSKLYEVLEFPFSVISSKDVIQIVDKCIKSGMGFVAMQPLCGGVVRDIPLAFGFLNQWENVVPLWGVQKKEELEQILYFAANPPEVDKKFLCDAEKTRDFFN